MTTTSSDSSSIETTPTRDNTIETNRDDSIENTSQHFVGGNMSTPTTRGQFVSFRPPRCLEFDTSSEDSLAIPNTLCREPVVKIVYIDDYNSIEKVRISEAQSHISVHKRKVKILAQKSETIFKNVKTLANEVNMKVNASKTQLLCIHSNANSIITSYIRDGNMEINSSDSLKILGFHFGTDPNFT